jgi:hypothetical protein
MTKKAKRIAWGCSIPVFVLGGLVGLWFFNFSRTHQHCIKISGTMFRTYADAHDGKFPFHTNGFGDALLLLIKENVLEAGDTNSGDYSVRYLTGPGDDGAHLKDALRTGADVAEEKCSRVYVQALSETNSGSIAILFDRRSTRGGDHFRSPWGRLMREVCMADGSMKTVSEDKWPVFAKEQVELLVDAGFERSCR